MRIQCDLLNVECTTVNKSPCIYKEETDLWSSRSRLIYALVRAAHKTYDNNFFL